MKLTPAPARAFAFIYGLLDPRDLQFRYVGSTILSAEERLACHLGGADNQCPTNERQGKWIQELIGQKLQPASVYLEMVPVAEQFRAETKWIHSLRAQGHDLTNTRDP